MLTRMIGIIGWLGTALVVAGVAVKFLRTDMPELQRGLLLAGLGCLLIYMLGQWREILGAFSRRQARYGALATASVLVVIGILVAINFVAERQNKRWDLTANQQFSVSDQTRRVLETLKTPVSFKVFAKDTDFDRFRNLLNEYDYVSNQVSVEYIDPDKKPAIARQYEIQTYGTIVVEHEKRTERVTSSEEQEVTNALIKAVEGQQKKVYFSQGHGEKDTGSTERDGYDAVSKALGRDNFAFDKVVLAQVSAVPADATAVVVAGPKVDFFEPEIEALRVYVRKGGKVLLMLDPPLTASDVQLTRLIGLAREWNADVGTNVVVDVSGVGQILGTDASVPVAATYPAHPITERFSLLTAFPLARSVSPITAQGGGYTPQVFVETSSRSWAESDIARLNKDGQVQLDEAQGDKPGPISIAVAVSTPVQGDPAPASNPPAPDTKKPESRLVVIGDSDFAANFALGIQGNRDLFLNIMNWLVQQENLIAVRPREPQDRRLTMNAAEQRNVYLLAVFIIPGLILAAGVRSWWKRR